MVKESNDLLKELQKSQERLKKISPRDNAGSEPYERNTLDNLQKAINRLKKIFRRQ